MFEEESQQENKKFDKFDLEGANRKVWAKCKPVLMDTIVELLTFNINQFSNNQTNVEVDRIPNAILTYANLKGENNSIKDLKILAEVEGILAEKAKKLAEARNLDLDTAQKKFNLIKEKLQLLMRTFNLLASEDPDLFVFAKDLNELFYIFIQSGMEEG